MNEQLREIMRNAARAPNRVDLLPAEALDHCERFVAERAQALERDVITPALERRG